MSFIVRTTAKIGRCFWKRYIIVLFFLLALCVSLLLYYDHATSAEENKKGKQKEAGFNADVRMQEEFSRLNIRQAILDTQAKNNCNNTRVLLCQPNIFVGFGALLHQYAYCLNQAVLDNRTFVFMLQEELGLYGKVRVF